MSKRKGHFPSSSTGHIFKKEKHGYKQLKYVINSQDKVLIAIKYICKFNFLQASCPYALMALGCRLVLDFKVSILISNLCNWFCCVHFMYQIWCIFCSTLCFKDTIINSIFFPSISQSILGTEENESSTYKHITCVLCAYSTVTSKVTVGGKYWKCSFLFQSC